MYTGRQALDLGLVDRIGTLADACAFAAEQAKVTDYDVRVVPEPKNFMEQILAELMGEGDPDDDPARVRLMPASFKSGNIKRGATFEFKFAKPGKYPYSCSYHPRMKGLVIVE